MARLLPFLVILGLQLANVAAQQRAEPAELTEEQREEIERLEALGYVGFTRERSDGPAGVVFHDEARAYPGLNLYTSGHAAEAYLIDMQGNELHRWSYDFERAFPEATERYDKRGGKWWRRVHLFGNGDLLAIFEGQGLIKLNKDSELIWASLVRAHHDLKVTPDGKIWVLTREATVAEYLGVEQTIMIDYVSVVDEHGKEERRISLLDALEASEFEYLQHGNRGGDIFHTNTLWILDGSNADAHPAFKKGNILTSFRRLNAIAVLDVEREVLVWAYAEDLIWQHDPELLPNGNLLIFDNRSYQEGSRVLELDPATRRIVWHYRGTKELPFFSAACGAAQRFPNGNTLISETGRGRAFEVTRDKQLVWEYRNPFRGGAHSRRIPRLAEMLRLPIDHASSWLESDEN